MKKLTHLGEYGRVKMVDVGSKAIIRREAIAQGFIHMQKSTLELIEKKKIAKGNVLTTSQIAGIQAAKRTAELIPLCHGLSLTAIDVDFKTVNSPHPGIRISACAKISARTGVEMEALTAVSVAALTIYDMCKAVDKKMQISGIKLLSKTKYEN